MDSTGVPAAATTSSNADCKGAAVRGARIVAPLFLLAFAVAVHAQTQSSPREARCIEASARYYTVPAALLRAIREQEGGAVGQWHVNADGSIDYGVMQINSRWLPRLKPAGYTASLLVYDACASIMVGAWILARALADRNVWNQPNMDPERYWHAVGEYHSRTPHRNRVYAEQVWARYQREDRQ